MAITPIRPQKKVMPDVAASQGLKITRNLAGTDDDQIIVSDINDQPRIPGSGEFDENLAAYMDRNARMQLASRLTEYAEADKASRADWADVERRGLEMMGLTKMPEASDYAPGVHKTIHPMLIEAITQFQARAITEMFPAQGPVKASRVGLVDKELIAQADRVENYLNYFLTTLDTGYFADTDQMLFYLPMSGSAFRKCGQNWITGMPELRYIKAVDFIAPYAGSDLESMPRYAHSFSLGGDDIRRAQQSGMMINSLLQQPGMGQGLNSSTSDLADMRTNVMHEDDELYPMLEYTIYLELEEDELAYEPDEGGRPMYAGLAPYVVLVETVNSEVLAVRRAWKKGDPTRKKLIKYAHHKLLPGLGFYGFGLPHVIGSLQLAGSGAVNALLDAAFMANFRGGFKTKDAKIAGELRLEAGVFKDYDGSHEDINKAFFQPDFKEPSNALANLLGMLVEAGRRFAGTMDINVGDQSSQNAPVGTTVALIEQANKPQSAIHKRLHNSMGLELQMLASDIYTYMPDQYPYRLRGEEQVALKADFDGRVDVIPVSDPNIYSSTQRIAIAQGVLQLQAQAPDLYSKAKRIAAHKAMLTALRAPDVDSIGPDEDNQAPKNLDPVTENALMFTGMAVRAFPQQDHQAHMLVVQNGIEWATNTITEPQQLQTVLAQMWAHYREHLAMGYTMLAYQQAGIPLPPSGEDGLPVNQPPEIEAKITAVVVNALPPAPMAQDASGEAEQAGNVMKLTDAKIASQQKLTAAEIERKDALAAAEIARKTKGFVADQGIKHKAADLDESRKDQAAATNLIRTAADAQVKRQNLSADAGLKRQNLAADGEARREVVKKTAKVKKSNKPNRSERRK